MNPCADMIPEYETSIADIDRSIKRLQEDKEISKSAAMQQIHNLETARGDLIFSLHLMREYGNE